MLAILPSAAGLGRGTAALARRPGSRAGGLLDARSGSAAARIIGLVARRPGHVERARPSPTGSMIGTVLLVFGAAAPVCPQQLLPRFSGSTAGLSASVAHALGLFVVPGAAP